MKFLKSINFSLIAILVLMVKLTVINIFLFVYNRKKKKEVQENERKINLLVKHSLKVINHPITIAAYNLLFIGLIVFFVARVFATNPKIASPKFTTDTKITVNQGSPFKITFDRPIRGKGIEKSISPELPGSWKETKSKFLFLPDTLIFTPDQTPEPDTTYTVSLKNINPTLIKNSSEYLLSFSTSPLPKVEKVTPKDGADGILPGQEILVETSLPHEETAKFEFKIIPEIELETKKDGDKNYLLKAKNGFKKSTTYTLEAWYTPTIKLYKEGKFKENGEKVLAQKSTFRTLEAPGVADYGPKGVGILVDSSVWISFKQDMNKKETEKALTLSGGVVGEKSWEGERKLILKPASNLTKNTVYTATLSKESKTADNTPFEGAFSFSFTTIGPVMVSGFSPGNNSRNVSLSPSISVTFNQAVDHASAQSKFSFSGGTTGKFTWNGNTMTYSTSGLGYMTRYTVNIAAGVKTVKGLDSVQAFSSAFTTKEQRVVLNVPTHRQKYTYSCMLAAGKQALAYKGVSVSEDTLYGSIPKDNTCFSGTWGGSSIWGDPYSAFVGSISGSSCGIGWGYGAYWGPTANVLASYRPVEAKTGWTVQGIAQEIQAGNPVIVWWVNGRGSKAVPWNTPGGKNIYAVSNMHAQTVKGFTGSVSNPTSFIVNDSGYDYPQRTFDVGSFKARWAWFGNSAVVVR